MADLSRRCESGRFAAFLSWTSSRVRHALDRVPTDCPLCLAASCGGQPCGGCLDDIRAQLPVERCGVCALGLMPGRSCPDCAALGPMFDRVISAFDYAPPADQLILQLKNAARFQHARFMADLLAGALRRDAPELVAEITIMLPVPSSRQALRRRGFNPAGEIARQAADRLGLPYRPGRVLRTGGGISQKRLSRADRTRAQSGRYVCVGRLDGQVVAVVDDVLTTGATLHAMARALKQAGAAKVVGLVAARTPYRQDR